ncbi:MAG: endolytic transglycosylase MltG, partial [Candidatus Aerophobetes bacterium]|nr:endolytic transglycosylase MltG [Candidatus Aerophobetes bacterium]
KGADSFKIAQILHQEKVIKNKTFFILLCKILNWEKALKAGKYEFNSLSMFKVLSKLRKGEIKVYKITIPEGLPKWAVAEILSQKGVVGKEDFLSVVNNPPQLERSNLSFPLPEDTLEGYLYPDTYYFIKGEDPQKIAKKFLSRFKEKAFPIYQEAKNKNGLSLKKVVTLASIVEKEARVSSEKPIIAGVFYNRLRKGMKLRADPTIKYALGDFRSKLTHRELKTPSIYNTYLHYGLPPSPICNPGKDSIYAVVHPAKVDYLYFVARGDGSHKFSKTYGEHLRAVSRYRKG